MVLVMTSKLTWQLWRAREKFNITRQILSLFMAIFTAVHVRKLFCRYFNNIMLKISNGCRLVIIFTLVHCKSISEPILLFCLLENSIWKCIWQNCGHFGARQWDIWITHDDVIKWKHFPRNWPSLRRIHRSPVNSPHKGRWRGALMFS